MSLPEDLTQQSGALRRLAARLVGDPEAADDVVQDAWVRALERPPAHPRAFSTWMLTVVRGLSVDRIRTMARRRKVETPLDEPPEAPTAEPQDAAAERGLELQATVLDAVRALPEPYRHTVWQRYFEDRPPREIAALADVPVKTVKTRLHRALGMLRQRLDGEHEGDHRAWAEPLAMFATAVDPAGETTGPVLDNPTTSSPVTPWSVLCSTWSLWMKSSLIRPALTVLVLFAGLAVGWAMLPDAAAPPTNDSESPSALTAQLDGADDDGESAQSELLEAAPVVRERIPATAAADPAPGAILLRVLWHDRKPAASVTAIIAPHARGLSGIALTRSTTDELGQLRFDVLPPGTYAVRTDRGAAAELTVESGAVTEHELVLDRGVDVVGTVVHADGSPAPGARVWLQGRSTDWTYGRVAARAGRDGRFVVRSVTPTDSVGALAASGAFDTPSELSDLEVLDPVDGTVDVQLELGPIGGTIHGTVVSDHDVIPIAGARIAIGTRPRTMHIGDRVVERWSPRSAISDENGHFTFDGVAHGEIGYAAKAGGHGLVRGEVLVEALATTELRIPMPRGATVFGRVIDESDRGVPGAAVRAYDREPGTDFIQSGQVDYERTLGHLATLTDADGTYRLADVSSGRVHLVVTEVREGGRGMSAGSGYAHHQDLLRLAAGSETEWSPTLSSGRVLEGRALYRDGHPLDGEFVTLRDASGRSAATLATNGEGRFRFVCLTDPTYDVYVQVLDKPRDAPSVEQTGVIPDRGPIEIRATFDKPVRESAATVTGRVVDVGKRLENPKEVTVLLVDASQSWRTRPIDSGGRFSFAGADPGRKRLVLMHRDTAIHHGDWFELAAGQRLDVGAITTSPDSGGVRATLRRDEGTEGMTPTLYLQRSERRRGTTIRSVVDDVLAADNLDPGDYQWALYAEGAVSRSGELAIRANEITEFEIRLTAGALCHFEVRYDATAEIGDVTLVYERDGHQFDRASYQPSSALDLRRYMIGKRLPPGGWRAVMTTTTGLRAEVSFTIDSVDETVKPVLDLR